MPGSGLSISHFLGVEFAADRFEYTRPLGEDFPADTITCDYGDFVFAHDAPLELRRVLFTTSKDRIP